MFRRLVVLSLLVAACGPSELGRKPTGGGPRDLSGGGGSDTDGFDSTDDLSYVAPDLANPGYVDPGKGDGGMCLMGQTANMCANPIGARAGCQMQEDCGPSGTGNGLDDDCNMLVDDGCPCTPGDVEPCFLGPPGKHKIGACTDGTQTCQGAGEFIRWGDCIGSIGPMPEVCDKQDNDCNGCVDDGLCCAGALDCPSPGDPRIADAKPYTDVALKGELFYTIPAKSWSWSIQGGPCDQLFATTTGTPPKQSFTLTNGNTRDATVHFTLSGDYTVTLTVVGTDGITYVCKWVQHVVGPGVRFELCWDHQGTAMQGGGDLDLHVHRPAAATNTDWFTDNDDCYYGDCVVTFLGTNNVNWGYTNTPLANCNGTPQGMLWDVSGSCGNPRLDIDNINDVGVPENSNIDDPKNGETFRVMVHYYGQDATVSTTPVEEHPIVNIYCGGALKATYGQTPNTLGPCTVGSTTCFNQGYGRGAGQLWRVADVTAKVDATGKTTDCTIAALHPSPSPAGYWVTDTNTGGTIKY
jgi:hypothetical protein